VRDARKPVLAGIGAVVLVGGVAVIAVLVSSAKAIAESLCLRRGPRTVLA
jgi:hypothetical protein